MKSYKIFTFTLLALMVVGVLLWQWKNIDALLVGSHTRALSKASVPSSATLQDYFQESQQLAQPQTQNQTVSFLAVGDIMLSRNVALAIQNSLPAHGPNNGLDYPFEGMSNVLKSTNFNFANLESPFDPNFKGTIGGHSLIFAAPSNSVAGLVDNNFKVLNLANNHAMDQGLTGLDFTAQALNNSQIAHEGTGNNLGEAWTPAVVTANGMKICFIGASFASVNDGGKSTNNYVARIEDTKHLQSAITQAKTECDFTVVTMHAGVEYTRTPDQAQIAFAHAAIDDGADVVIGAHPHWVQTVEKYNGSPPHPGCKKSSFDNPTIKNGNNTFQSLDLGPECGGKYIFYSLGNFIFDQDFSADTQEGLALKITVSKAVVNNPQTSGAATADDLQGQRQPAKLESIELIPLSIQNSQPRVANDTESKNILNKIGQTQTVLSP